MNKYLDDIEKIIIINFNYIRNWNNEIADSLDTTFLITKKNFVIIGLNSINESLLENIIFLYYKKYFSNILNETNHVNYCNFELLKIDKVIKQNHDGSFNGFSSMNASILGNIIGKKEVEDYIKNNFIGNLSEFKEKLREINKLRNKLGHNSEFYFKSNTEIKFQLIELTTYIDLLEEGFIKLSKLYYESMEELLNKNNYFYSKKGGTTFLENLVNKLKRNNSS